MNILNKIKKIDPKMVIQALTISSLFAFTFNWLWDLEARIINLERDARFEDYDDNDPRFQAGL